MCNYIYIHTHLFYYADFSWRCRLSEALDAAPRQHVSGTTQAPMLTPSLQSQHLAQESPNTGMPGLVLRLPQGSDSTMGRSAPDTEAANSLSHRGLSHAKQRHEAAIEHKENKNMSSQATTCAERAAKTKTQRETSLLAQITRNPQEHMPPKKNSKKKQKSSPT